MPQTSRFLRFLLVFLFLSLLDGRFAVPVNCQERTPTDGPCTDAMAQQAKGRWIHSTDLLSDLSLPFQKEASKRLDEIHRMLEKIYPSPIGVDAVWHRAKGHILFAEDITHVKGIPVGGYYYTAAFFRYFCDPYSKNQLIAGYPGETSTRVRISANCNFPWGSGIADETWTIDGRPVTRRPPLKQMWKGYPMFHAQHGSNTCYVLIHREGTLPYIPVTRKQYLDHSIQHLAEIFDKIINTSRQLPVRSLEEQEAEKKRTLEKYERSFGKDPKRLKSATDYYLSGYQTDQQRRDEQVSRQTENKSNILKRYQDELEKTTRERLLDSPAITLLVHSPDPSTPIFVTEAENGSMLITENPAYFRKDLPKYVPQTLVLNWSWDDWEPQRNINKIVEESFPLERLQAMIDR